MITGTNFRTLPSTAPSLLFELREAFDSRLMELHNDVLATMAQHPPQHADHTVHVFFEYGTLLITAVYHCGEERFTQLIARDTSEVHLERPSYTLSLFL